MVPNNFNVVESLLFIFVSSEGAVMLAVLNCFLNSTYIHVKCLKLNLVPEFLSNTCEMLYEC